jgi:hypothetical protein
VRYVILIHSNPDFRQLWTQFSPDEQAAGLRGYQELDEQLTASGELVVSEALGPPASARRVTLRDGELMTTDGPFAEAKEYLAGIYLVDCESMARAVEIAGRVPEAEYGLVEVRPVMSLDAFTL